MSKTGRTNEHSQVMSKERRSRSTCKVAELEKELKSFPQKETQCASTLTCIFLHCQFAIILINFGKMYYIIAIIV